MREQAARLSQQALVLFWLGLLACLHPDWQPAGSQLALCCFLCCLLFKPWWWGLHLTLTFLDCVPASAHLRRAAVLVRECHVRYAVLCCVSCRPSPHGHAPNAAGHASAWRTTNGHDATPRGKRAATVAAPAAGCGLGVGSWCHIPQLSFVLFNACTTALYIA